VRRVRIETPPGRTVVQRERAWPLLSAALYARKSERSSALPVVAAPAAAAKAFGIFSLSQSSFGISISGEITPPTLARRGWPPALMRAA